MPVNDIIQAWLLKAAHDLQTAQIVASHLPDFDDTIAFHCQQAIEKSLKGYLVYLDIEFKPVHDLGYLLNLVGTKDESFNNYYDQVVRVSRFAVQIRYPDQVISLTKEQIGDAIDLANLIFKLVQSKITNISH